LTQLLLLKRGAQNKLGDHYLILGQSEGGKKRNIPSSNCIPLAASYIALWIQQESVVALRIVCKKQSRRGCRIRKVRR